jgi:transporter family-2 protein
MLLWIALAFLAGALVSLSRQINGRLALSTSALASSFWNHIVGFVLLSLVALALGGLTRPDLPNDPPLIAYVGGPLGVIFVAASSWLVTRIGAVQTALLIIAGQMVSGVLLDLALGAPGSPLARAGGVGLILAGMWLTRTSAKGNVPHRS